MTREELDRIASENRERNNQHPHTLRVCYAASCLSLHSDEVKQALESEIKRQGRDADCTVKGVGCLGLCSNGPLVAQDDGETIYQRVTAEDAERVIKAVGGEPITDDLRCDSAQPFFQRQEKVVLHNVGVIDPDRIEDYIAHDGYQALHKAVTGMTPAQIVEEVTASGLRGRGGAGYSAGLKWKTVVLAHGEQKYVVCNGDEGDPGAYMDRSVLESDPHRVLEGMAIAAYAVGASKGYAYIRAEYPLAVKRMRAAIRQAERFGALGNNIFGTNFSLSIELRLGAGAFVCGEETALLASIEGKRGTPRTRPPYPAERGLWDRPTLINNVETYASVASIIRNGSAWFANIGTGKSKGTKVFALAGRVKNTGLVEVPLGATLRDVVFELGGGIPDLPDGTPGQFKAAQTGGPSGGCIPAEHLDIPLDYESLAKVGSIVGSGGLIVMDQTSCVVDIAKYFTNFCMTESCGQCTPCRAGLAQMHAILEKITHGLASLHDLAQLEELCDLVKNASMCGLGQSAPNPVLSTLRFFRDEYMAHILEHRCPAGVCKIQADPIGLHELPVAAPVHA